MVVNHDAREATRLGGQDPPPSTPRKKAAIYQKHNDTLRYLMSSTCLTLKLLLRFPEFLELRKVLIKNKDF